MKCFKVWIAAEDQEDAETDAVLHWWRMTPEEAQNIADASNGRLKVFELRVMLGLETGR